MRECSISLSRFTKRRSLYYLYGSLVLFALLELASFSQVVCVVNSELFLFITVSYFKNVRSPYYLYGSLHFFVLLVLHPKISQHQYPIQYGVSACNCRASQNGAHRTICIEDYVEFSIFNLYRFANFQTIFNELIFNGLNTNVPDECLKIKILNN